MCKDNTKTVTVNAKYLQILLDAATAVYWNAEEYIKQPCDVSREDLRGIIGELLAAASSVSSSLLKNL